jgi:putative glutamine amidotransferase
MDGSDKPAGIVVPVVGLSACRTDLDGVPNYVCRANYADAVIRHAGCLPVVLPAIGAAIASESVVSGLDGLLLTGSVSNVDPAHYGQERDPSRTYDMARDASVFALIRAALATDMPVLAICRGLQELNVALGGSLFQNVHEVDGKMDHREDETQPRSIQYAPVHQVQLAPDGLLSGILGASELKVGSLHWQGIDRLGRGLRVEARAEDGLVEAVTLSGGGRFVVGVQWHPEWFADDPAGALLFGAFGKACEARHRRRLATAGAHIMA